MKQLLFFLLVGCAAETGSPNAAVCIDPAFNDGQIQSILIAGNEWKEASNGRVDFTFGIGMDCGDLQIKVVSHLTKDDGSQALARTSVPDHLIRINLDDTFADGSHPADYDIREIAEHELGHWMTGPEHSVFPEDIMYGSSYPVVRLGYRKHLTWRDIARLDQ